MRRYKMAQKRMFDKSITNSDDFIDMPDSAQNLYFHLSMNADDDGFINNWKNIMRMTGHKEDDMKILIAKQYVIVFDSGVIVIRHWRINNYLRGDRYIETKFKSEKQQLQVDESMVYQLATNGIPPGIPSIEEKSKEKNSIEKNSIVEEKGSRGKPQEEKVHFAEFVSMTNAEYDKLVSTYGKDFTDQCITTLDNYKGSKGAKYKNDYRAILSWVVKRVQEDIQHSKTKDTKRAATFSDLRKELLDDKGGDFNNSGDTANNISQVLSEYQIQ